MAEEIFSRQKHNNKLRASLWTTRRRISTKIRWGLFALTFLAILLPSFFIQTHLLPSHTEKKAEKAQTQSYPTYPIPNLPNITEPIGSYPIYNPEIIPVNNPADLPGSFNTIGQAYQQMQNQMNACVQRKNQVYNQLVTQHNQLKQLQLQRDALDDAIWKSTDDGRTKSLENQRDRIQQMIDALSNAMNTTQDALDHGISQCKDSVSDMQYRIDDMESKLYDQFSNMMDYRYPGN